MTSTPIDASTAPSFVRHSNRITLGLLRLGLPMGPNVILTVRGRTSGLPRSAPVALVETDGRRWILGAYGEVNWVRNLRAAGEADIAVHGRTEHVEAVELDQVSATAFFRDTLAAYVGRLPRFGRLFARTLFRTISAEEILTDPELAAARRPVFELLPLGRC